MCKYCEDNKTIFEWEEISEFGWLFGKDDHKINLKEAQQWKDKRGIFIDRGYLRKVYLDDCECMDHGDKIKMNYCFNCGREL